MAPDSSIADEYVIALCGAPEKPWLHSTGRPVVRIRYSSWNLEDHLDNMKRDILEFSPPPRMRSAFSWQGGRKKPLPAFFSLHALKNAILPSGREFLECRGTSAGKAGIQRKTVLKKNVSGSIRRCCLRKTGRKESILVRTLSM